MCSVPVTAVKTVVASKYFQSPQLVFSRNDQVKGLPLVMDLLITKAHNYEIMRYIQVDSTSLPSKLIEGLIGHIEQLLYEAYQPQITNCKHRIQKFITTRTVRAKMWLLSYEMLYAGDEILSGESGLGQR